MLKAVPAVVDGGRLPRQVHRSGPPSNIGPTENAVVPKTCTVIPERPADLAVRRRRWPLAAQELDSLDGRGAEPQRCHPFDQDQRGNDSVGGRRSDSIVTMESCAVGRVRQEN
jgi:hypothetical protein